MQDSFFAMLSRMKNINRWALMRNSYYESLSEHSLEVAIIAHALCVIRNTRLGGNIDAEKAATYALFHDVPEILTGDLPTPVKYYNEEIRSAYKKVEAASVQKLLCMLPEDMRPQYAPLLEPQEAEYKAIVKAADKLSALIKCIEESRAGNTEFASAESSTLKLIEQCDVPEAQIFLREFIPAYRRTLDEQ